MQALVRTLLKFGELNVVCQKALGKAAAPFEYPAQTHLLAPGMVQDQVYFIDEGIVMSHYRTRDKQFINWFAAEGDFATSMESFHYRQPSREHLTACTHVKGMVIIKKDYDEMIQKFPSLALLVRKVTLHYLLQSQLRLHNITMLNSYERYALLVEERPDLLRQLPGNLLAAYLHMDPTTFSKMRKKYRDESKKQ